MFTGIPGWILKSATPYSSGLVADPVTGEVLLTVGPLMKADYSIYAYLSARKKCYVRYERLSGGAVKASLDIPVTADELVNFVVPIISPEAENDELRFTFVEGGTQSGVSILVSLVLGAVPKLPYAA